MTIPRRSLAIGALVVVLCGPASAPAQETEQKIACKEVPAPVRAAFAKTYPKATIKGCATELEEGKTAYEITSTEGKTGRDVLYYPDGKLIVVEETIAQGGLPEPVRQAVRKSFPGGSISLSEKVTRDASVAYEFHLKHKGKSWQVVFDPDGKEVRREEAP
jgi:hypothetical protein